jgi:hypothetical protein
VPDGRERVDDREDAAELRVGERGTEEPRQERVERRGRIEDARE